MRHYSFFSHFLLTWEKSTTNNRVKGERAFMLTNMDLKAMGNIKGGKLSRSYPYVDKKIIVTDLPNTDNAVL